MVKTISIQVSKNLIFIKLITIDTIKKIDI